MSLAIITVADAAAVKKADLAGSWYPASKTRLDSMLDTYLDAADVAPVDGTIKAIIVPHAGLVYSGPVAAYSYKAVQNGSYPTVVLLGFCHRKSLNGIAVYKEGTFETPLGPLEVDATLVQDIISRNKSIMHYPSAFENENSIELELPFIKKVLPNSKIVPIAFGSRDYAHVEIMADIIAELLNKRDDLLVVVSADMSHFHSHAEAQQIDAKTIELMKRFAAREIYTESVRGEQLLCGYMPVAAILLAAKKAGTDNMKILRYANSGDISGDKSRVVGYVSAVIYEGTAAATDESTESGEEAMLNNAQRKRLLSIARDTVKTYLQTGKVMQVTEEDPVLNREMGAFVTLHKKGQLRGCIGNIIGRGPLYLTVRDMAIESAIRDPRFQSVTRAELDDIDIEISVLSELERVEDAGSIELGVHGVLVRKGYSSGVFLPQVATETGWSKEEFLSNLCSHKAGLLPDAWKTGEADLYIFTADVFGEKNH